MALRQAVPRMEHSIRKGRAVRRLRGGLVAVVAVSAMTTLLLVALSSPPGSVGAHRFRFRRWRFGCVDSSDHVDERYFDPDECVTREQRTQALTALAWTIADVFERLDVDYWLESGTLLGQFRAKSVIPWDTDVDVSITMAAYQFLRDLQERLELPEMYTLEVYESKQFPSDERDWNIPVRLVDSALGFYVDVFVFQESVVNGVEVLSTTPSSSWDACAKCLRVGAFQALLVVPKSYVFPLISCDLAGHRALCPAQRTKYLEHLYGDSFRIPQQT